MSTKGCASETVRRDTTFSVHECPVDRRPCEVLGPLHGSMVEELGYDGGAQVAENAKKYGLPCGSCRKGERDARNLPGLRLGKHERRILLLAPPGSKCGWRAGEGRPTFPGWGKIIYPEGPSRAAEEANRRALRKLEHAGLVELSREAPWAEDDKPPPWFETKQARSRYWAAGRKCRTAKLTHLGEVVVQRCRHQLEGGKAIRWQKLLDGIAAEVRQPPGELFRLFGLWCNGIVFYSTFGSAFARTTEGRQRAKRRTEAIKRFQAFVSEKASEPEVPG